MVITVGDMLISGKSLLKMAMILFALIREATDIQKANVGSLKIGKRSLMINLNSRGFTINNLVKRQGSSMDNHLAVCWL